MSPIPAKQNTPGGGFSLRRYARHQMVKDVAYTVQEPELTMFNHLSAVLLKKIFEMDFTELHKMYTGACVPHFEAFTRFVHTVNFQSDMLYTQSVCVPQLSHLTTEFPNAPTADGKSWNNFISDGQSLTISPDGQTFRIEKPPFTGVKINLRPRVPIGTDGDSMITFPLSLSFGGLGAGSGKGAKGVILNIASPPPRGGYEKGELRFTQQLPNDGLYLFNIPMKDNVWFNFDAGSNTIKNRGARVTKAYIESLRAGDVPTTTGGDEEEEECEHLYDVRQSDSGTYFYPTKNRRVRLFNGHAKKCISRYVPCEETGEVAYLISIRVVNPSSDTKSGGLKVSATCEDDNDEDEEDEDEEGVPVVSVGEPFGVYERTVKYVDILTLWRPGKHSTTASLVLEFAKHSCGNVLYFDAAFSSSCYVFEYIFTQLASKGGVPTRMSASTYGRNGNEFVFDNGVLDCARSEVRTHEDADVCFLKDFTGLDVAEISLTKPPTISIVSNAALRFYIGHSLLYERLFEQMLVNNAAAAYLSVGAAVMAFHASLLGKMPGHGTPTVLLYSREGGTGKSTCQNICHSVCGLHGVSVQSGGFTSFTIPSVADLHSRSNDLVLCLDDVTLPNGNKRSEYLDRFHDASRLTFDRNIRIVYHKKRQFKNLPIVSTNTDAMVSAADPAAASRYVVIHFSALEDVDDNATDTYSRAAILEVASALMYDTTSLLLSDGSLDKRAIAQCAAFVREVSFEKPGARDRTTNNFAQLIYFTLQILRLYAHTKTEFIRVVDAVFTQVYNDINRIRASVGVHLTLVDFFIKALFSLGPGGDSFTFHAQGNNMSESSTVNWHNVRFSNLIRGYDDDRQVCFTKDAIVAVCNNPKGKYIHPLFIPDNGSRMVKDISAMCETNKYKDKISSGRKVLFYDTTKCVWPPKLAAVGHIGERQMREDELDPETMKRVRCFNLSTACAQHILNKVDYEFTLNRNSLRVVYETKLYRELLVGLGEDEHMRDSTAYPIFDAVFGKNTISPFNGIEGVLAVETKTLSRELAKNTGFAQNEAAQEADDELQATVECALAAENVSRFVNGDLDIPRSFIDVYEHPTLMLHHDTYEPILSEQGVDDMHSEQNGARPWQNPTPPRDGGGSNPLSEITNSCGNNTSQGPRKRARDCEGQVRSPPPLPTETKPKPSPNPFTPQLKSLRLKEMDLDESDSVPSVHPSDDPEFDDDDENWDEGF